MAHPMSHVYAPVAKTVPPADRFLYSEPEGTRMCVVCGSPIPVDRMHEHTCCAVCEWAFDRALCEVAPEDTTVALIAEGSS